MITYIICGVITTIFLLLLEIRKEGFYSVTIIDLFIAWATITLWPIVIVLMLLKNKISITKELFKLK